jgi:hypothetical protein
MLARGITGLRTQAAVDPGPLPRHPRLPPPRAEDPSTLGDAALSGAAAPATDHQNCRSTRSHRRRSPGPPPRHTPPDRARPGPDLAHRADPSAASRPLHATTPDRCHTKHPQRTTGAAAPASSLLAGKPLPHPDALPMSPRSGRMLTSSQHHHAWRWRQPHAPDPPPWASDPPPPAQGRHPTMLDEDTKVRSRRSGTQQPQKAHRPSSGRSATHVTAQTAIA